MAETGRKEAGLVISGERVRAARKARGFTLVELASRARLSYSYLSEIERGAKTPSSEVLARLADALDLSRSDLVGMSEEEGGLEIGPGEKLRIAREDRGMTLRDVASAAGISSTYLSEIERGNAQPAVSVLKRLARVLHVPLSMLMSPAERKGFLGEKLRKLRERLGMTQAEVAARAGVSAALVGQIELGRVCPSLKTINKIATALGVSSCYLLLESEGVEELIPGMTKDLRDLLQDPNVQILLSAVSTLNQKEMRFVFEMIALLKRSGISSL